MDRVITAAVLAIFALTAMLIADELLALKKTLATSACALPAGASVVDLADYIDALPMSEFNALLGEIVERIDKSLPQAARQRGTEL